jgi:hypothetical protein
LPVKATGTKSFLLHYYPGYFSVPNSSGLGCIINGGIGSNTATVQFVLSYFHWSPIPPNGKKNSIWKLISSVLSSLYEMELENIKERTTVGRQVYVQKGGILGRPTNSTETEVDFLKKEQTQRILMSLKKGLTIREIFKVVDCSNKPIIKTKKLSIKHGMLSV